MRDIISSLKKIHSTPLTKAELSDLITSLFLMPNCSELFDLANEIRIANYAHKVFVRGLIEFTNFCQKDCLYCGIRRGNSKAERYRLTSDEIMSCCDTAHKIGLRSFVLQGGEDPYFTDERMVNIIKRIKNEYPDTALTLSIGEKTHESYLAFFEAGADRYLLRHETANEQHYKSLHPTEIRLQDRLNCLWDLKNIGFQVGAGFMVGSPFQTSECLADDLLFLMKLQPQMIGLGPFIPHIHSPFYAHRAGSLKESLVLLSLTRIMLPNAMLPSTTALGSIAENGRLEGLKAGANVVMPNISPSINRSKYLLYNNKAAYGAESLEGLNLLMDEISTAGFEPAFERGDHLDFQPQ